MTESMMNAPLSISDLLLHAVERHPTVEIITRTVEGSIHRYNYQAAHTRAQQLANALERLGTKQGDRIATLAWNTHRHFELYFAVSGMGAILHTINPRLFAEQIDYIINHAEDRFLFVDLTFVPLLEQLEKVNPNALKVVEGIIIMTDKENMPTTSLSKLHCYEELLASEETDFSWPQLAESTPASLCYTSGTTGNPKGVMYTHRSTILHALAASHPDALALSGFSTVLPVVPMFHVNAWGIPYSATFTGSRLVFPGAGMDGQSLYELIDQEQANLLLGVPTVWLNLLNYLDKINSRLDSVDTVVIGGSAAPLSMIKKFNEVHGAYVLHAWGMTELSPLGTCNAMTPEMSRMPLEERYQLQLKQGRAVYPVQLKIVDDDGKRLTHDGKAFGKLLVRGPWVVNQYYKSDDQSSFIDGWFDTGDVANIDPNGYMQIVDRSKDVIKSGGEWISSIDLENVAVGHPGVKEACVIGAAHPKWDERPILLIIPANDSPPQEQEILDFLEGQVAKWWLPDAVIIVDELPHTATGKLLKTELRETYHDYLLKSLEN